MKTKILKQKKNPGSCLKVAHQIAQPIQPNLRENGLDWLCYLSGNFQTTPTIFFIFSGFFFFLNNFIKNPQTRNALTFWPFNISAVGRVNMNGPSMQCTKQLCISISAVCSSDVCNLIKGSLWYAGLTHQAWSKAYLYEVAIKLVYLNFFKRYFLGK